ncbi:hypothetical protein OG496_09195 [Streptomyces sp. NBC_00988]|uniref:hypothetical protein n=1 Tax=Streptomyces sp. NBC_00988 TaxID=2903704 RepID=UPI003867E1B9|nr:hypothetical protein OG496_09195 [Streptomyces sp. NBC_00988]
MTVPEPLTPENVTIVMIDHAVGFANLMRSHDLGTHFNNVGGLARTATLFETGLVVTNDQSDKPSGPDATGGAALGPRDGAVSLLAGQVDEHGEPGGPLYQRADRRPVQPDHQSGTFQVQ